MKTKFARYFSQLGRFGRESISKQSDPTATNSDQTSFSHSRTRGKMRMKCGRVYEKHVYEGTQNTPTVEKTCPTWCGSNATNSNQSKGFAPFVLSWLTTSRKISTTSEFEFTAICRVCSAFWKHETIWLRRQRCSEYVKYRTNGVQRRGWREQADNRNLIFLRKFTFKLHQPIKSSLQQVLGIVCTVKHDKTRVKDLSTDACIRF